MYTEETTSRCNLSTKTWPYCRGPLKQVKIQNVKLLHLLHSVQVSPHSSNPSPEIRFEVLPINFFGPHTPDVFFSESPCSRDRNLVTTRECTVSHVRYIEFPVSISWVSIFVPITQEWCSFLNVPTGTYLTHWNNYSIPCRLVTCRHSSPSCRSIYFTVST